MYHRPSCVQTTNLPSATMAIRISLPIGIYGQETAVRIKFHPMTSWCLKKAKF